MEPVFDTAKPGFSTRHGPGDEVDIDRAARRLARTNIASSAMRVLSTCVLALFLFGCGTDGSGPTAVGGATDPGSSDGLPVDGDADLKLVADLPNPASSVGGVEEVVIKGDVLQITVFGVEKLNNTVQVDSAGRINLALIGEVHAAGKSVRALESEIRSTYGRTYLNSPNVQLALKESAARSVVLDGPGAHPGVFPVTNRTSLLETIARGGGLAEIGDPSKVFVYRVVDNNRFVANYNVTDIRNGKRPDPRIYGGDKVVVFSSGAKVAWSNVKDVLGFGRSVAPGVGVIH